MKHLKIYKVLIKSSIAAAVLIFAGSVGGTTYFLYTKSKKPPVAYELFSPEIADIKKTILVPGKIVPHEEIKIKPKIPGIIGEINVQVGDEVKKDQVLSKINVVPEPSLLNDAYNRYNKAKIGLLDAERGLHRSDMLHSNSEQIISTKDFQKAEKDYQIAKSELEAAQSNLKIVEEGGFDRQGAANHSLVRSTISGTILEIPVKVGDTIIQSNNFNEGTTIAVVADMRSLIFEGDVDESEVHKLHKGMQLRLSIGAIENKKIDAVLSHIAPKGDDKREGQVKFKIKADIKIPPGIFLRAGYSANAEIILAERKNVLSVDESCLKFDGEHKPYVDVRREGNKFIRSYVELGLSDGIRMEVLRGLSLNDEIKR